MFAVKDDHLHFPEEESEAQRGIKLVQGHTAIVSGTAELQPSRAHNSGHGISLGLGSKRPWIPSSPFLPVATVPAFQALRGQELLMG